MNNDEEIRLLPKDGIKKAIERQKNVKLTTLPIGVVYLNNKFVGCILIKHKGIQIHKLTGLSLNTKRKIFLNVLQEEKELLDNNIYHIDLANSPYISRHIVLPNNEIITKGHSHILVNPFNLQTNFIDLDGKSTIYTEKFSENFKNRSLQNLNILTLEFLFKIDYDEYYESYDELCSELYQFNIKSSLIDKLASLNADLNDIEELSRKLVK